jgi:hypothetical protein
VNNWEDAGRLQKRHTHTPRFQALPITVLGLLPKKARGRVSCFLGVLHFRGSQYLGLGPLGVAKIVYQWACFLVSQASGGGHVKGIGPG